MVEKDGIVTSFIAFLETGRIESLSLGAPVHDVRSVMGNLQEFTGECGDSVRYLKVGPIQFRIEAGAVAGISVLCLQSLGELPAALKDFVVPPSSTTPYDFIDMLEENGIAWNIERAYTFDRQLCISVGDHVLAFFDLDARELQKLVVES